MHYRIVRGLVFKGVGLLAKAVFLFVFANDLKVGEFAIFFGVSTIVTSCGALMGMGADYDLAFRVRGNRTRSTHFIAGAFAYYVVAIILLAVVLFATGTIQFIFLAATVAFLIAGTAFMVGALRSHSNLFQEIHSNIPWLIVCAMCAIWGVQSSKLLFAYLVVSHFVVLVITLLSSQHLGITIPYPNVKVLWRHLLRVSSWLPKLLSIVGILALLRAFPIWLWILGGSVGDSLAYIVAISEVIWQICMIHVHQVHSDHRNQSLFNLPRNIALCGALFLVASVFFAVCIHLVLALFKQEYQAYKISEIAITSAYCSTIATFCLLRIFIWGLFRPYASIRLLGLQAIMFITVGFLCIIREYDNKSVIAATITNILITILYAKYYRHDH